MNPWCWPAVRGCKGSGPLRGSLILIIISFLAAPSHAEAAPATNYAQALCHAVGAKDEGFLREHVELPLVLRQMVNEGGGNPRYRTVELASPKDVIRASICSDLELGSVEWKKTRQGWTATMPIGQFDAKMEFTVTTAGWRLRAVTK